jgi:hypothetical protein
MPRQSFWTPLSLLIAGLVVIVILLAGPNTRTDAGHTLNQSYPNPTATSSAYPGPGSRTPTTTATRTPGTSTPTVTGTRTTQPTQTRTLAANPTGTFIEPSPPTEQAQEPTDTPEATEEPTFTPTPTDELACAPGQPIVISGSGPPRAPFLLYFDQRAVSGGSIEPDGHFLITLVVGNERAGIYPVVVRVRGSSQVLRQLTCTVPPTTPTPLPTTLSSIQ